MRDADVELSVQRTERDQRCIGQLVYVDCFTVQLSIVILTFSIRSLAIWFVFLFSGDGPGNIVQSALFRLLTLIPLYV